jgi:uncharacterized protein
MSESPTFVYLLQPNRPDFIETMTAEEEAVMSEHFEYLQGLLAEGKLVIAGPCLDAKYGIAIFRASSMEEARDVMERDPAVVRGVMTATVHPYRISLMQNA